MAALRAERAKAAELQKLVNELTPLAEAKKAADLEAQSNEERAVAAAAEAQANAAAAQAEVNKLNAALENAPAGMDLATVRQLAGRLQGSTPEELSADAVALFSQLAPGAPPAAPAPGATPPPVPVSQLQPGGPTPAAVTPTAENIATLIAQAELAGETDKAKALKAQQFMLLNSTK